MKKNKSKKKMKKAINELAAEVFTIYFENVANARIKLTDGSINSDYTYYSGMIDGMNHALMLLDKKAVPLIPPTEDIEAITVYPFFDLYDEVEPGLFTSPEVIEEGNYEEVMI
jgi:hypothetical protein